VADDDEHGIEPGLDRRARGTADDRLAADVEEELVRSHPGGRARGEDDRGDAR
jgi:hypothetical protein